MDVDDAVAQLQQKRRIPIKAVIMVPTYRAAAKFIEKTRNLYPDMIYTSVSFVGSTALADELMLLGKKYTTGVIVTLDTEKLVRLQICTRQIFPWGGAGLCVSGRLRGCQCVRSYRRWMEKSTARRPNFGGTPDAKFGAPTIP